MMAITFAVALKAGAQRGRTAWGIGIALVALVALVSSTGYGQPARRATLAAAAVIWGLRLAVHIGVRNRGQPEDPRYRNLLSRAKGQMRLRAADHLPAAGPDLVGGLPPIQAGISNGPRPARWSSSAPSSGWAASSSSRSATGSWPGSRPTQSPGPDHGPRPGRYTRHPNYFGDFCMWWGLFRISLGSRVELLTIVGPLLMTFLLTRGSGQRLTERRMAAGRSTPTMSPGPVASSRGRRNGMPQAQVRGERLEVRLPSHHGRPSA